MSTCRLGKNFLQTNIITLIRPTMSDVATAATATAAHSHLALTNHFNQNFRGRILLRDLRAQRNSGKLTGERENAKQLAAVYRPLVTHPVSGLVFWFSNFFTMYLRAVRVSLISTIQLFKYYILHVRVWRLNRLIIPSNRYTKWPTITPRRARLRPKYVRGMCVFNRRRAIDTPPPPPTTAAS